MRKFTRRAVLEISGIIAGIVLATLVVWYAFMIFGG